MIQQPNYLHNCDNVSEIVPDTEPTTSPSHHLALKRCRPISVHTTRHKDVLAVVIVILIAISNRGTNAKPIPTISTSNSNNNDVINPTSITLYSDTNFKGLKTTLILSESCVNLSGSLNDAASSVDADGGCAVLCEHSMCRGRCEAVNYYSSDLSRIGLNDVVTSIKPCYR